MVSNLHEIKCSGTWPTPHMSTSNGLHLMLIWYIYFIQIISIVDTHSGVHLMHIQPFSLHSYFKYSVIYVICPFEAEMWLLLLLQTRYDSLHAPLAASRGGLADCQFCKPWQCQYQCIYHSGFSTFKVTTCLWSCNISADSTIHVHLSQPLMPEITLAMWSSMLTEMKCQTSHNYLPSSVQKCKMNHASHN